MSFRTALLLGLSLAVTLSSIADLDLRGDPSLSLIALLVLVNAAIWCSWPRYRATWLRQATTTLTLLIAANLILSPLRPFVFGRVVVANEPNVIYQIDNDPTKLATFNDRGHRTNGPIDYERKEPGTLRIVAIGASTTEQLDIDDRATWTALVARDLAVALGRKVEMINTGVAGARARQNLDILRASETFSPDIALFLLGINDWNAAIKSVNVRPSLRLVRAAGVFSFFDSVLFQALLRLNNRLASHPMPEGSAHRIEETNSYLPDEPGSLERTRKVRSGVVSVDPDYASWIGRIVTECRRRNILCLFVEQPTAYAPDIDPGLRAQLWMTPPDEPYTLELADMAHVASVYNSWLARTVRDAGLPFCATVAGMPARSEFFYDDCHFTEAGSRRLASLVAQCLVDLRSWLPAPPATR